MTAQSKKVIAYLKRGWSIESLISERADGRVVVRGLQLPGSKPWLTLSGLREAVALSSGSLRVSQAKWTGIHFVDCVLSDLSFFQCELKNCIFHNCNCSQVGLWESAVYDCAFEGCDLRAAVLGGVDSKLPKPNVYQRVTFRNCDMRSSTYAAEEFTDCNFVNSRLDNIGFHGSRFVNCTFKGRLYHVSFCKYGAILLDGVPANLMTDCDFRDARLTWCEFRNIDVSALHLPDDPNILILPRGSQDWLDWGRKLDGRVPMSYFEDMASRSGTPSMVSLKDLREVFQAEDIAVLERVVAEAV